jgi:DNA mismatch repair protein MutS
MVEMSEVSNIITNATNKSLLILDEIGRGTSTYDGLSIAWSVIEYIADKKKIGARTLFATHYHELTELEGKIKGIKNYCIQVEKKGDEITFLRKIARGGADDSYGIQVAKIAGLPENIIQRAKEILNELEVNDINKMEKRNMRKQPVDGQIDLFVMNNIIKKSRVDIVDNIRELELEKLTPVQAMNYIYELQQKIKKG